MKEIGNIKIRNDKHYRVFWDEKDHHVCFSTNRGGPFYYAAGATNEQEALEHARDEAERLDQIL